MKRIAIFLLTVLAVITGAQAKKMSDLKVYINPGHGGYTSNDRPIQIYPFASNDSAGYWESKSNLYKGLHMYHILDSLGAKPYLSRTKNTEADDRSLSGIAAEANQLGVDLFFSIHSNAGEAVNYPLMLYRENTIGTPRYPENVTLSNILWDNLHSNQMPIWTMDKPYVEGDLTFYQNMWQGGLGVLRTLYVVGLLSEGGMHEHRPEAHRLMNDDYWWLEAWHFVRSIMEFYQTEDRFVTGNVAGVVYDNHNLRELVMPCAFTMHGRDKLAPLNGASVELLSEDGNTVIQRRTTDNMYNGVYVFRNVAPGKYQVRTSMDGYHSYTEPVEVKASEVSYHNIGMSMSRPEPLKVESYSPAGAEAVSCASSIVLTFNYDIDTEAFEKAFKIEPAVAGYFKYSDSYHTATFVPELSLDLNTHYTVTLSTDACHPDTEAANNHLDKELIFEFDTKGRNRLEMIDNFPADGGNIHYAGPTFEFRFDKFIDASTVYNYITVTDSKGKELGVNKRTSKFNQLSNGYGNAVIALTSNLTPGEKYTVKISGELRDRETLPLVDDAIINLTAVDVSTEHDADYAPVFNELETNSFAFNAEHTTGITTSQPTAIRSTSVKLFGSAAQRFTYKFASTHGGDITWDYTGEPVLFNHGDTFGGFFNGDFNNHKLYAIFTSGTDTKYVEMCDLNFLGWRYLQVELDVLEQGFTYLFSGFRLEQVESPITQNGYFGVDNISRHQNPDSDGVQLVPGRPDTGADISATPNPTDGLVTVTTDLDVRGLALFNASGMMLTRCTGNTVDLGSYPRGIYYIRVATPEAIHTIPVIRK